MVDDLLLEQMARLLAMLPESSAEVDVEDVQLALSHMYVYPQASARFAARPRDVVVALDVYGKTAQHDVAVARSAQPAVFTERAVKAESIGDEAELILDEVV